MYLMAHKCKDRPPQLLIVGCCVPSTDIGRPYTMMSTLVGVQGVQCLGNAPCSSFEFLQFRSNGHQWVSLHVLLFWVMVTCCQARCVQRVPKIGMRVDQYAAADGM